MSKFSLLQLPPSETLAISALANEKKRAGQTVYSLSAGEPMVPTPAVVTKAVMQALKDGKTHYPPVAGIPELRIAASGWINEWYGTEYQTENTLVSNGGKFGLFILLEALLKPNDEVLIPAPYWVSYPAMVKIFGGVPKIIETTFEKGWKISPESIAAHTNSKTKAIILNNAGNPTGAMYEPKELEAIMKIAAEKNLLVISDEVYSGLVYDGKKFTSCGKFKQYKDNLVIIQSCSKSFAMTGLRIGFVFAPTDIIKSLSALTSQSTSGVSTLSQYAALAAIKNAKKIIPSIAKAMQTRRDAFVKEFEKSFKQKIFVPKSGLYVFVHLSKLNWGGRESGEFCRLAMEKANVAAVPGAAFGMEGYVRFSFGDEPKVLVAGIKALAKWVASEK